MLPGYLVFAKVRPSTDIGAPHSSDKTLEASRSPRHKIGHWDGEDRMGGVLAGVLPTGDDHFAAVHGGALLGRSLHPAAVKWSFF